MPKLMNESNYFGWDDYLKTAIAAMKEKGIEFAPGLSSEQIQLVEVGHGFCFPPDLRSFLERGLPVSKGFPDWRNPCSESIRDQLAWPVDGICFDIEHNGFWLPLWGARSETTEEAQERARQCMRGVPVLIPVFSHRYLPSSPPTFGNPVFSVYQTDCIYYGYDLPSYLRAEFGIVNPFPIPNDPRAIDFWDKIVVD